MTQQDLTKAAAAGQDPVGTRVLDVPRGSESPTEQLGAPGTAVYAGWIVEQEKDDELRGTRKYETYANLLANTAIVAAGVRFFLDLVAKPSWKVEPADDSPAAAEMAERVEVILHDMATSWRRVVRRAALFPFYGFGLQEWTAKKREDGTIGFLDVEPRAQRTIERWDTDEHGNVLGAIQVSPQTTREIYLPREKLVYMVDDSIHDSPEGLGIFRHLTKGARALERLELLEAWGYENDLRGIPVLKAPLGEIAAQVKAGTLKAEEAAALLQPLKDFARHHIKSPVLGLLLDSSVYRSTGENQTPSASPKWGLDLSRGVEGGPHQFIAAAIERKNRELARILRIEHLLLGSDSRGSHALSTDKSQNMGLVVDGTLLDMAEIFQRDLLGPLFRLNGWDRALTPNLKTDALQYRDIEQVTGALKDMAAAGAMLVPDDPAADEVRDLLGLSRAPRMVQDLAGLPGAAQEEEAATAPEHGNEDAISEDTAED